MQLTITDTTIGQYTVASTDARELHKKLNIVKDFSDWIKAQIKRAGLENNVDYTTYHQKGVGGKFDSIDYILTIDAGKHIAMMSQSKQAKAVRDHFIKIEKEHRSGQTDLSQIVLTQNTTIALLQKQLESIPKQIENKHPKSGLNPVDHNTLLELIYQFSAHKQNLRARIRADIDTESNIENFLVSVKNRYPEFKEYIDKHSEGMEHLPLNYTGMSSWKNVKK